MKVPATSDFQATYEDDYPFASCLAFNKNPIEEENEEEEIKCELRESDLKYLIQSLSQLHEQLCLV